MPMPPAPDKRAKTVSNVRGRKALAALQRDFKARVARSLASNARGARDSASYSARPTCGSPLHTPLLTKRITSGGGEHTYLMPDLDTQTPYGIEATSALTYDLGQKIEILVCCRIAVDSEIDDMTTHVRPLLWWKLEELTVEMVNYPIL